MLGDDLDRVDGFDAKQIDPREELAGAIDPEPQVPGHPQLDRPPRRVRIGKANPQLLGGGRVEGIVDRARCVERRVDHDIAILQRPGGWPDGETQPVELAHHRLARQERGDIDRTGVHSFARQILHQRHRQPLLHHVRQVQVRCETLAHQGQRSTQRRSRFHRFRVVDQVIQVVRQRVPLHRRKRYRTEQMSRFQPLQQQPPSRLTPPRGLRPSAGGVVPGAGLDPSGNTVAEGKHQVFSKASGVIGRDR